MWVHELARDLPVDSLDVPGIRATLRRVAVVARHPCVPTLREAGVTSSGSLYVITDRPEGAGPPRVLPPGDLPVVAGRLASCLATAHRAGLLVGPLGPRDITVDPGGGTGPTVLVTPPGLAWLARRVTGAEDLGPDVWIPPEVVAGGGLTDLSDRWWLGRILGLLAGDEPPPAIAPLIAALVADDPDDRPPPAAVAAPVARAPAPPAPASGPPPAPPVVSGSPARAPSRGATGAAAPPGGAERSPRPPAPSRRGRRLLAGSVLLAGWLLAALAWMVLPRGLPRASGGVVAVPDLVGTDVADAERLLTERGLTPRVVTVQSPEPAGRVLRQRPEAGRRIARGDPVELTVSEGRPPVEVPGVVGEDLEVARGALEAAGFEVQVRAVASAEPAGTVVGQDPAPGTLLVPDQPVVVEVSNGRPPVEVPDVVGTHVDEARRQLEALGLRVVVAIQSVTTGQDHGRVLRQVPSPGQVVEAGATVTITVGERPAPTTTSPPATTAPPG